MQYNGQLSVNFCERFLYQSRIFTFQCSMHTFYLYSDPRTVIFSCTNEEEMPLPTLLNEFCNIFVFVFCYVSQSLLVRIFWKQNKQPISHFELFEWMNKWRLQWLSFSRAKQPNGIIYLFIFFADIIHSTQLIQLEAIVGGRWSKCFFLYLNSFHLFFYLLYFLLCWFFLSLFLCFNSFLTNNIVSIVWDVCINILFRFSVFFLLFFFFFSCKTYFH